MLFVIAVTGSLEDPKGPVKSQIFGLRLKLASPESCICVSCTHIRDSAKTSHDAELLA